MLFPCYGGLPVKKELQMKIYSFDPSVPPRCREVPELNGHKRNCLPCLYAQRRDDRLYCSRFNREVPNGQKYSLKEWKSIRTIILARDGYRCIVCDASTGLHIHHIDGDSTNDNQGNLITLCNFCHAKAHSEFKHKGGPERVLHVINYYQVKRGGYIRNCRPE
jgi:5-methylcytosine-specific restriction endonuclease McrA